MVIIEIKGGDTVILYNLAGMIDIYLQTHQNGKRGTMPI